MKYWLILFAFMTAMPVTAAQPDRSSDALRCVATLAIIANDQARGAGELGSYPPLAVRGARFARIAGEAAMRESGQSREQVRTRILAEVAAFQTADGRGPNPVASQAPGCIAMLDKAVPPPTLPYCAAIVGFAYDDVHAREGLTKTAKDLATIAAVLAGRAREELRALGKTEAQGDVALGLAREAARSDKAEPDLESCFERARP